MILDYFCQRVVLMLGYPTITLAAFVMMLVKAKDLPDIWTFDLLSFVLQPELSVAAKALYVSIAATFWVGMRLSVFSLFETLLHSANKIGLSGALAVLDIKINGLSATRAVRLFIECAYFVQLVVTYSICDYILLSKK
jgi:hypothetical protein